MTGEGLSNTNNKFTQNIFSMVARVLTLQQIISMCTAYFKSSLKWCEWRASEELPTAQCSVCALIKA